MAANFVDYKYQLDSGGIARVRADAALGTTLGVEPTATVNQQFFVKTSKGNREFGVRPRLLKLQRVVTSGTLTRVFSKRIPILTPAAFAAPENQLLQDIDIDGVVWTVVGRQGEDY